jgi:UDP-2,3-diacylglucosamine pyrophosphatase LpxH
VRSLADDTLVAFLSDSHIGGDQGRDIFETPGDLGALWIDLGRHNGPVELVLAGDFFDFLRIGDCPQGQNRARLTIERPEYRDQFAALARLGAAPGRHITYIPGNHDAEMWRNPEIQGTLVEAGLVHEFALSYAAAYRSAPGEVIYCEHGNQFDPANAIHDYSDAYDSPLGQHVVTDLTPRLPRGQTVKRLNLGGVDRVFPLSLIPEWITSHLFYDLVSISVRWLLLPLAVLFIAHDVIVDLLRDRDLGRTLVDIAYDAVVLSLVFAVFLLAARGLANRAIKSSENLVSSGSEGEADPTVALIRDRLEDGQPPPMAAAADYDGEIAVFVSGHTHAPSLTRFRRANDGYGAQVNSGCWLSQLQPIGARFGAPPVFVSRFVQTHVRILRHPAEIEVELWEHPRAHSQRLTLSERLVASGRVPAQPGGDLAPRVRQRLAVAAPARRGTLVR